MSNIAPSAAGKKVVPVIVHGDVWGAYNANKLVKAVHERGAVPILIVTRSTPGKDGTPLTKLEPFRRPRALKENIMLEYFRGIDALHIADEEKAPEYMTFNALASTYCGQDAAYYTTKGGMDGGKQILAIFEELKGRGITPEIVLSGDTLAILPAEITDNYDCFGTHPGPLPAIRGMQGTARSLINSVLFDHHGNRIAETDWYKSLAHVKGSFFHLATNLDEGPVIETALAPAMPGMCLLHVRSELYWALTEVMVNHLDILLDSPTRKGLIAGARMRQRFAEAADPVEIVPELEERALREWMDNGVAYFNSGADGFLEGVDVLQNTIVNPIKLENMMRGFYPKDNARSFNAKFDKLFGPELAELQQHLQLSNPQLAIARLFQAMVESGIKIRGAEGLGMPRPGDKSRGKLGGGGPAAK